MAEFAYNFVWAIIYVAVIVGGLVMIRDFVRNRFRLRKKRARFAQREALPISTIYQTYYATSGLDEQSVVELWLEVARKLKLDPQRLRPTDRFDREFAPVENMNALDELEYFDDVVHKRAQQSNVELQIPWWHLSLDEYIKLFAT